MPWKERSIVEERMRFVLRLKDGESMASLCREFGISRVTGYKIYERYKECGLEGLTDRARTPYRYANKLPAQLEAMIVSMRRQKPTWGARKLRDRLLRKLPNDVRVPACSTIHAILDRHGLVATAKALSHKNRRYPFIPRACSECFVVHRLQGRVHAGRQKILLSPYRLGPRQPLSFALRSHGVRQGTGRVYCL
jgi:transposase